MSVKSVRNVHGCLHVALGAAVARGYLPRNVADLANPPKARRARSRNARDHCWTREQLVTFLEHTRDNGDRLPPLWFLIATTGLRRAEALALRWADPAVTMQVYAHAVEGDDATAETTANAIFDDR